MQRNLFYIVFLTIFLTLGNLKTYSQEGPKETKSFPPKNQETKPENDTVHELELQVKIPDSLKKKPLLESKIKRKAVDYEKFDQKKKLITLYNKAEVYYQDIELKSGIIVIDYNKSEVYAGRIKDSTGAYTQRPVFKQGNNVVEPDSIRFNFKTKKALVWNSRTEQGEFKIKAGISKRENDSVYFMKGARFTTAKDIEDPEYYFQTNKLKFVPGKKVVVGPTNMVIAGVPTPIILPFAFFPMDKETRASGIIIPTFADNNERGFSLQNGGYYFNLTDNYDLAILGDYFTSGGYALRAETNYAIRYKFRGNFNLRYENQINGERGFANYSKTKIYNIQWSHSRDSKSNPNSNFSASVNLGSSRFFQQSLSQSVIGSRLNTNLSSSVSFSQRFNSVPQVNLSLTATHSQVSGTQSINMTLPTLQLNVDQIFPFAPKDGIKKGFFKNINLQYSLNGRNEIVTTDSLFFTPKMFKDAKIGFQHSIPLSTNFKVFKYFSASTSATYNEVWALKTIRKNFDENQAKVITTEVNGFDAFRTYNFNASLNTTVYGTFKFGDKKRIQAIRHLLKPSISYSYQPSFEKYYDSYAVDALGNKKEFYTRFEGGINGVPGNVYSSSIGLSIANTFEAKVRDQDSTKTEAKKVMLLNNLNVSTSYDLVSKLITPISLSANTQFFDSKLGVNLGASLDPYAIDNIGNTQKLFNVNNGGSLFRLTSANLTLNYSLSSRNEKEKKKKDDINARNGGRNDDLFGKSQDLNASPAPSNDEEVEDNSTFFNSKVPWDLTLAYSLTYTNAKRENTFNTNSVMFSGNINLTSKWKIGGNSGFDLVQKKITITSLSMERDLLSWRMSFNWVPIGVNTSWGFFIGIKSSALSDIKYDRNNLPDPRLR